jgi:large subunit ribosomal protein L1
MNQKDILNAVKQAREGSKERKFKQTFDLVINFRDLDLKNPAHKLKDSVVLPHGRGKPIQVAAFADGVIAENAKKAGIEKIIDRPTLKLIVSKKKEVRKLANTYDFFLAQTDYMVDIGKSLGAVLGPRNKMPQPVPPNMPVEPLVKRFEKLVNVRIVNQPVIHCRVGTEEMTDEQLTENINAIVTSITRKAPRHETNIRSIFIKTTMGQSVKVGGIETKAGGSGQKAVEEKPKATSQEPKAEPDEKTADGGKEK